MQDVKEVVERIEPVPAERGDWEAVVRAARRRRPVLVGSLAGIAAAAGALFVLVLFQPWSTDRRTFLERALAAVDDGPVIHAVLRGDWGGTNVDLETGARTPLHGENEIWYDRQRKLIRLVSRLGETVTHDRVYEQDRASPELIALGRDYRAALESGSARIAGEDIIDGQKVTWVVVVREMLPDSSDQQLHEWTVQIAVSNETFKPVATRDTRDGKPGPGALQRVLELEAVPAEEVDLTVPKDRVEDVVYKGGKEPIAVDRAADVLGRTPVWLGREHAGLPLAHASETWIREGRQKATEHGPVAFGEKELGVSLFYGALGDDPSTYRKDVTPLESEPFVRINETTEVPAFVLGGARIVGGAYFSSEGTVFLAAGGRHGTTRSDGLYVVIQASSEELILSAARALKPMPG
jgi:hypothetical protein